jgi:hypothetical protein
MIVAKILAADLLLLAKEETVLQGVTERQTEIGRYYGMEMNVEKTKMMRISEIMIDQKTTEECRKFQLFGLQYNK